MKYNLRKKKNIIYQFDKHQQKTNFSGPGKKYLNYFFFFLRNIKPVPRMLLDKYITR